jgi:hypothetical protein
MNHGIKLESETVLNFGKDIPLDYMVKISHNFSQVLFVSPNFENSLIERGDGNYN